MFKLLVVMLSLVVTASSVAAPSSADLPTRKYLNLAAIKTMVAAAEAEAKKQNVEVTICIVDESGNLLFLQKADGASLNTIQFAQRKARHAAFYRAPSKSGADAMKKGDTEVLAFPDFFPNQGGLPIQVDGQTLGGIAASGAKSEIDEAISQAALDALLQEIAEAEFRRAWRKRREVVWWRGLVAARWSERYCSSPWACSFSTLTFGRASIPGRCCPATGLSS